LLCSPEGTDRLVPGTLKIERVSDDMALAHDDEHAETLFRTPSGVELRAHDGKVLQRCDLPTGNRVEAAAMLPERILISVRQRLGKPEGIRGQIYLLPRSGPPRLSGHPRFQGVGMHRLARIAGSIVFSPGNGVLVQVDEAL